jgi:myo-inositol-1(or 4)-monophosphatase
MDYKQICSEVIELCKKVGHFITDEKKNFTVDCVEYKDLHDLVSYVDKEAEYQIVESLSKIIPDAGFITEEKTKTTVSEDFNWIIDPLDGTTNYVHGLAPYCISIALKNKNEIVVGVVYELNLNEIFYSWKGGEAMLNGYSIKVSKIETISKSLLATGFPYKDFSKLEPYMIVFNELMFGSHGLRRLGSAAADLVYVACGRMDAFYEYGLNSWDVAAGSFIVEQAGGKVTAFDNKNNWLFDKEIIASNGLIHKELYDMIYSKFNR